MIQTFPRAGKKGRPRRPKLLAHPQLLYGQVVKQRDQRYRITHVEKRAVYGSVALSDITTSYIEWQNLNFRYEIRRLTRKTVTFSKEIDALKDQLSLYRATFNLTRPHRELACKSDQTLMNWGARKWQPVTPAMTAGLTNHVWSLKGLLSYKLLS